MNLYIIYKYILFWGLSFLTCHSLKAQNFDFDFAYKKEDIINEKNCPSLDLRKSTSGFDNLSSKKQLPGMCYAYAGAQFLNFYRAKKNNQQYSQEDQISPLYLSYIETKYCDKKVDKENRYAAYGSSHCVVNAIKANDLKLCSGVDTRNAILKTYLPYLSSLYENCNFSSVLDRSLFLELDNLNFAFHNTEEFIKLLVAEKKTSNKKSRFKVFSDYILTKYKNEYSKEDMKRIKKENRAHYNSLFNTQKIAKGEYRRLSKSEKEFFLHEYLESRITRIKDNVFVDKCKRKDECFNEIEIIEKENELGLKNILKYIANYSYKHKGDDFSRSNYLEFEQLNDIFSHGNCSIEAKDTIPKGRFKKIALAPPKYTQDNIVSRLEFARILKTNGPIMLGHCYQIYSDKDAHKKNYVKKFQEETKKNCNGQRHTSNIIGMRLNKKTHNCEVLIRNTKGKTCSNYASGLDCDPDTGDLWVTINSLTKNVNYYSYFESP